MISSLTISPRTQCFILFSALLSFALRERRRKGGREKREGNIRKRKGGVNERKEKNGKGREGKGRGGKGMEEKGSTKNN